VYYAEPRRLLGDARSNFAPDGFVDFLGSAARLVRRLLPQTTDPHRDLVRFLCFFIGRPITSFFVPHFLLPPVEFMLLHGTKTPAGHSAGRRRGARFFVGRCPRRPGGLGLLFECQSNVPACKNTCGQLVGKHLLGVGRRTCSNGVRPISDTNRLLENSETLHPPDVRTALKTQSLRDRDVQDTFKNVTPLPDFVSLSNNKQCVVLLLFARRGAKKHKGLPQRKKYPSCFRNPSPSRGLLSHVGFK